jgi:hypothetical protein
MDFCPGLNENLFSLEISVHSISIVHGVSVGLSQMGQQGTPVGNNGSSGAWKATKL